MNAAVAKWILFACILPADSHLLSLAFSFSFIFLSCLRYLLHAYLPFSVLFTQSSWLHLWSLIKLVLSPVPVPVFLLLFTRCAFAWGVTSATSIESPARERGRKRERHEEQSTVQLSPKGLGQWELLFIEWIGFFSLPLQCIFSLPCVHPQCLLPQEKSQSERDEGGRRKEQMNRSLNSTQQYCVECVIGDPFIFFSSLVSWWIWSQLKRLEHTNSVTATW